MDEQEYLNQISADSRPVQPSKFSKIITSKFFLIGAISIVALTIIIIIGTVINANKTDIKSLSFSLKLHLDNTSSIINDYQNKIKSSDLRSSNASLSSIISSTNKKLTDFITNKFSYNAKNVSSKITDQANLEKDNLNAELFQAKINGNLDRIYAHKMAYQIQLLSTEESKIYKSTKDDELKSILSDSYNSLQTLYDSFNNFSETK